MEDEEEEREEERNRWGSESRHVQFGVCGFDSHSLSIVFLIVCKERKELGEQRDQDEENE